MSQSVCEISGSGRTLAYFWFAQHNSSEPMIDGPVKCFNPSKNWRLGWYQDKALQIDLGESWTGRLVAFVDYEAAEPSNNEYVLLQLNGFLFVQYNRAKGFNAGTSLHKDKVVVVIGEGGQTSSSSVLRAGLGNLQRTAWKGVTIEVCSLRTLPLSSVDYAEVSVYPTGSESSSMCALAPSRSPSTLRPSNGALLLPTPPPSLATTPRPVTSSPVTLAPMAPSTHPSVSEAWVQVGDDINGSAARDESGSAVAMSSDGTVLVVGAPRNDRGGVDAGHIRVFFNTGGVWQQRGNALDGSAPGDRFGYAVALSADGTIVAAGARLADGVNGANSGRVVVFQWNGSEWESLGPSIDGAAANDQFGYSIALSDDGTVMAVGAFANRDGGTDAGQVKVFAWTGTEWNQRGDDLNGSSRGDHFGDSVSLSSDGSIVACSGDEGGPGYVRIYLWSGSGWLQQGSTLSGLVANDEFGESVSLSGNGTVVAVGADLGNYVMVFRYDGTDWFQVGPTIRGVAFDDRFGWSVALSLAGDMVVVGGRLNDANGPGSGHARVYRLSGMDWVRVGPDLVGEAAGDNFGSAVAVSHDGTRIAVGAPGNDGNESGSGHVRVFDMQ